MKFSDGYWRLREGVRAAYPQGVLDVETGPGTLTVHAPTYPVRHRGDLLKGPALTLTCTSPMPDVIAIRITHFAAWSGARPVLRDRPPGVRGRGELRRRGGPAHLGRALGALRPHRTLADGPGGGRAHAHQQRRQGHGHHGDPRRPPPPARTARAAGRHLRLRPRRALRPAGEERPGHRHLERRRRHRHRTGVQERPVLPHRRGLRRLRRPPRPGLLRGRLGGGLPDPVQRPGPGAHVLRHPRPHPQGDPAPLHRAHRPPRAAPRLVLRAVAVHLLHHLLRRGDGHRLRRRHGRARTAAVRLPLRLLLDARVPVVRLHLGSAGLPRPGGHAAPTA